MAWWQEAAIRKRNAALGALAGQVCPEGSPTAWPGGSTRLPSATPPPAGGATGISTKCRRYCETPKAQLWRAFKAGAAMPIGERHLRSILVE